MALKTIAHALFSWTENGIARMATHGETVDIDDDVIATYERFGVFEPDVVAVEPEPEEPPADEAPAPALTEPTSPTPVISPRPRQTAPEHVWQEYAREHGLDPDGMDRHEIIRHFTEQEPQIG